MVHSTTSHGRTGTSAQEYFRLKAQPRWKKILIFFLSQHGQNSELELFIVGKTHISPAVSLHFPPRGRQRIKEQPAQGTTVWAWLKMVVIL